MFSDSRLIPRMKKLLLVAAVLMGGVAASQAGLNISIGIGVPRHSVVIRHPVPVCPPPVYIAPPVCRPRMVVPGPPVFYQPGYEQHHQRRGYDRWDRRGQGRHHWR